MGNLASTRGPLQQWDSTIRFVLFEETGKFLVGRVLSQEDTAAQVDWARASALSRFASSCTRFFSPDKNEPQPLPGLREQLSFFYRLAKNLKAKSDIVRGKP